jgi:UDP-2,3-diacylglucosamine pyrophosphatase LpxH
VAPGLHLRGAGRVAGESTCDRGPPRNRGGLMIVVISDLHFEEEARDAIRNADGEVELSHPRNIPVDAYCRLIGALARAAQRERADSMKLVLAGDIFELYQTALWFSDGSDVRPYTDSVEEGSALESMILSILDAIAEEDPVRETLELLRLLAAGRYRDDVDGEERDFPVPVTIEYIPGNHDRPANGTPAIRAKVRELLGMKSGTARFPNYLVLEDPRALIRHGHEYDPYNFAVDYCDADSIPLHIPREHYDGATLGDFITIDVVARLPVEFRKVHSPEGILADHVKRAVYRRLLEFEDVRPQSALLEFLLKMPKKDFSEEDVWNVLEPVVQNIVDDLHSHPVLHYWIRRWGKSWRPDRTDLARLALKAQSLRKGISLTEARLLSRMAGEADISVLDCVAKEEAVREEKVHAVVCGHTHKPTLELAAMHGSRECYFMDVGTWRHRIPVAHDESGFGIMKSLTYLILYRSREGRGKGGGPVEKLGSFDYWSGLSRQLDA